MYSPRAASGLWRSIRVAWTIPVCAFASGPPLANGINRGGLSLTLEYVAQLPSAHAKTASANASHRLSVTSVFIVLKARRVLIDETAPVDKESLLHALFRIAFRPRAKVRRGT